MKASAPGRSAIRALMLAATLAAGAAFAQDAPTRVGYVDMKRLVDNAPQIVAGRQKIAREFAERDNALKADETRLAALNLRYTREADVMTKADADALKREIDALDRSLKRNRDAARAELKTRTDQETDRSWREMNNAVVEFAREKGYDLIVTSPVLYASPRVDITDAVLERLRRDYQAKAPAQ